MPALRRMSDKRYHTRNVLTVDEDKFRDEFAKRNAIGDDQIGDLIGVDPRTVRRVRSGEVQPSTGFHANCLAAGVNFGAFVTYCRSDAIKARAA